MSNKTMPVFASGMYIKDNGNLVINADEMDAAGVRKLELIEVKPTEAGSGEAETLCECGHSADTHDPCCVSACGCDGFEPRKPSIEDVFKAAMREIKELAQESLGYEQICEPIQAVRRLAQEFAAVKAQLASAHARAEHLQGAVKLACNERDRYEVRNVELEQRLCIMVERAENHEAQLAEEQRTNAALCETIGEMTRANTEAHRRFREAVSILADMHDDEGCQFKGARGKDVGCLACLAQIALNGPAESAEELRPAIFKALTNQHGQVFCVYLSDGKKIGIARDGGAAWLRIEDTPIVQGATPESTAPAEEVKE